MPVSSHPQLIYLPDSKITLNTDLMATVDWYSGVVTVKPEDDEYLFADNYHEINTFNDLDILWQKLHLGAGLRPLTSTEILAEWFDNKAGEYYSKEAISAIRSQYIQNRPMWDNIDIDPETILKEWKEYKSVEEMVDQVIKRNPDRLSEGLWMYYQILSTGSVVLRY